MPVGFYAEQQPSGSVQLDETHHTFGLIATGTQASVAKTTQGGTSKLIVSMASVTNPVLGLKPTAGHAGLMLSSLTAQEFLTNAAIGSNFDWLRFDSALAADANTYGLQIFDAAGALAYSSNQKQARITAVLSGSAASIVAGSPYTYTSGRTYAVAFQTSHGEIIWTQGGVGGGPTDWWENRYVLAAKFTSAHVLDFIQIRHSWAGPIADGSQGADLALDGQVLVLDVTGY